MDPIRTAAGAALAAAALGAAALAQPPPLAWPEAIARLAAERTRANTCVEQARALGVAATDPLARGYGEAKAEMDGVIAGLSVALAEGREAGRAGRPAAPHRGGGDEGARPSAARWRRGCRPRRRGEERARATCSASASW